MIRSVNLEGWLRRLGLNEDAATRLADGMAADPKRLLNAMADDDIIHYGSVSEGVYWIP